VRFVRAIARLARRLAVACGIAAALMVLALYDEGWTLALAAIAVVPAVVLFLFSVALGELAELPGRLRGAPGDAARLRTSLEELGRARGPGFARALWQAGRQAASARELATPWAPLLPLVSLPFLAATAVSAIATPAVLLVALVVLVAYA
jgi:hypothetical protein